MLFRQLFDAESSTYTYLLADEISREAALIDPVREQIERDVTLLSQLGLKLKYALDTHVHADHVTASGPLRERLGCQTGVSRQGEVACADLQLEEGHRLSLGATIQIEVLSTPGHTNGCLSYRVGDRLFTGDALLIRGTGRTDFQQGDSGRLYDMVTQKLFTLPDETFVYPGHDYRGHTVSTIGEEKRHNPRLGGKTREEYKDIMSNLKLSHPKKIQEAVPANLNCGVQPREAVSLESLRAAAGPLPSGQLDVAPAQVQPFLAGLRVIDVREPAEFNDALGHIQGAELVPVDTLGAACQTWNRAEPLILICRSGKRSIAGGNLLRAQGFAEVYNLTGGMLGWNQAGLPVVKG